MTATAISRWKKREREEKIENLRGEASWRRSDRPGRSSEKRQRQVTVIKLFFLRYVTYTHI